MLKSKEAFTLGEVLLALLVFGILAAMMLPNIANVRPDKNKVLFKKAYHTAERIVYEIVNDEALYPVTGSNVGFDNTDVVAYMGNNYGGGSEKGNKFCKIFAQKVNLSIAEEDINCVALPTNFINSSTGKRSTSQNPSFITTDGISWYMPAGDSGTFADKTTYYPIYVDVNGAADPNCVDTTALTSTDCGVKTPTSCSKPDTFKIGLRADGKMRLEDCTAMKYLQKNSQLK